jgi:hypothetical protein
MPALFEAEMAHIDAKGRSGAIWPAYSSSPVIPAYGSEPRMGTLSVLS